MSVKTGLEYVGCIDPWTDEERLSDEEIVRCGDCKHMATLDFSGLYGDHDHDLMVCQLRDNYVDTYDDCFCSWGERKVDE